MGVNSDIGIFCNKSEVKFNLPLINGDLRAINFNENSDND